MAYDLALSPHGDLIFAGNRDFAGVSGIDLVNQRITIRLTTHRGTWFYDLDGTLGSDLYQTAGKSPDAALEIDARVRDALREMDDIDIQNIDWIWDDDTKSLIVKVEYMVAPELDQSTLDAPTGMFSSTTVTIPVIGGA
jgi:archaellin